MPGNLLSFRVSYKNNRNVFPRSVSLRSVLWLFSVTLETLLSGSNFRFRLLGLSPLCIWKKIQHPSPCCHMAQSHVFFIPLRESRSSTPFSVDGA